MTINHHPSHSDALAGFVGAAKGTGNARYYAAGTTLRYVEISPRASRLILKATENWTPLGTAFRSALTFGAFREFAPEISAENFQKGSQKNGRHS